MRDHFFGRDPRAKAVGEEPVRSGHLEPQARRHDYRKVYAAYRASIDHKGQPTVILAKTIKGYTLGAHFEGRNATHQMKKLALEDLKGFRDSIRIPISTSNSRRTRTCPRTITPAPRPRVRHA